MTARSVPRLGLGAIKLWVMLLAIGAAWGLTVPLTTVALGSGLTPLDASFWSAVFSLVALSAWLGWRGGWPPLDRQHVRFFLTLGLVGAAFPHVASFYAAAHLPAGVRAVLFAFVPLFTLVLSLALALERPSLARFVGLSCGVLGVAVLFRGGLGGAGPDAWFWGLCAMAAVASYAAEKVYLAIARPQALDPIAVLWGMNLSALGWFVGAFLLLGPPQAPPGFGTAEWALFGTATLHLFAYGGMVALVARAGPVFATQVSYVVAPCGVLWGAVIFAETLSADLAIALVAILAGISLIRPNAARARTTE